MPPFPTLQQAREHDQQDPLSSYRKRFALNDPQLIYLDGNSLGAMPQATHPHLNQVIQHEWSHRLIRSWNEGWYERSRILGAKIARLIGANEDEVIMADSTSVNLFKLAYGALKLQEGKTGIVSDELNFPSDIYLLQGLMELFGQKHHLRLAQSHDGISVSMEELEHCLGHDTALLTLSLVVFKSAFMYNVPQVTQMAHDQGALVLWDLSHATGAVPLHLNDWNVDMAIGCTYKYLNGGPGSPAFLYVRRDLQQKLQSPIWGWFGELQPFDFGLNYRPAEDIRRFQAGTPPLLSLSAIEPAVDMLLEAGMEAIRQKSIAQGQYLIGLYQSLLQPLGFSLGSPENPAMRGSHIALRHPEAYRICKAMIDPLIGNKVVIPDFREPDNIRLGITPLYIRFVDLYEAILHIQEIVQNKYFERFPEQKDSVT